MTLCLVTSVFHLRKTRPLDYYLQPAIHLLEDMASSDVNVCLFTDQDESLFPKASNIHIFPMPADNFIKEMWDCPYWKDTYTRKTRGKKGVTEQQFVPELLAIWLGKFPMMKIGASMGDRVLWQDSGILMAELFNKEFNTYQHRYASPKRYISYTNELIKMAPLTFMLAEDHPMSFAYHGVYMKQFDYSGSKPLVRAGFMLASSSEVWQLQEKIKKKWNLMLSRNLYGTEENPLTLYHWERRDSKLVKYYDWLQGLGLMPIKGDDGS